MSKLMALLAAGALAFSGSGCKTQEKAESYDVGFEKTIHHAKDKVFPAVVYVKVLRELKESGKDIAGSVSGSGVIISPDGEVVTNHHVIDKALNIRCLLSDGKHYEAELIGSDKEIDLALIRLKLPPGTAPLQHADFSGQPLMEGDFVMAMGAPFGLNRSVTIGIISSARRYLPRSGNYSLWYQTDAAIFPGNSGGPLVNTKGEIIGINTLGVISGGMGFSIPSGTIEVLLPRFRAYKQANWAWLGLELQPLRDFDKNIYFDGDEGVIIAGVEPGSPAESAGILSRDLLLAVGGKNVTGLNNEDIPAINRMIGLLPFDAKVTLTVKRGTEILKIDAVPVAKGKVDGDSIALPRWGITVKAINRFGDPNLYFYREKGFYVFGIDHSSISGTSPLQPGDIIEKINDTEISTPDDLKKAYQSAVDNSRKVNLTPVRILRGGNLMHVVLDFTKVQHQ